MLTLNDHCCALQVADNVTEEQLQKLEGEFFEHTKIPEPEPAAEEAEPAAAEE